MHLKFAVKENSIFKLLPTNFMQIKNMACVTIPHRHLSLSTKYIWLILTLSFYFIDNFGQLLFYYQCQDIIKPSTNLTLLLHYPYYFRIKKELYWISYSFLGRRILIYQIHFSKRLKIDFSCIQAGCARNNFLFSVKSVQILFNFLGQIFAIILLTCEKVQDVVI